jgi:hypothetical protein
MVKKQRFMDLKALSALKDAFKKLYGQEKPTDGDRSTINPDGKSGTTCIGEMDKNTTKV